VVAGAGVEGRGVGQEVARRRGVMAARDFIVFAPRFTAH
jgi:hypothetical protein